MICLCFLQRDGAEAGLNTKRVFSADLLPHGLSHLLLPRHPHARTQGFILAPVVYLLILPGLQDLLRSPLKSFF